MLEANDAAPAPRTHAHRQIGSEQARENGKPDVAADGLERPACGIVQPFEHLLPRTMAELGRQEDEADIEWRPGPGPGPQGPGTSL